MALAASVFGTATLTISQPASSREKILIFKILQDYLWSIWTVLKESRGDDFGSYGLDRFTRAQKNIALWETRF